nr:hypothetical protein [Novosphingobium kaempferiae]
MPELTYYHWQQLYGGMEPLKLRKMRRLGEEKLKRLVAYLSLDKAILQELLAKA